MAYGNDQNQFADLRFPKGKGTHALAIAFMADIWRAKYDLGYMGHLCAALAVKGIATANLEYRRVGNPGGGWPGTFADIRIAYQFLLQNARKLDSRPNRWWRLAIRPEPTRPLFGGARDGSQGSGVSGGRGGLAANLRSCT